MTTPWRLWVAGARPRTFPAAVVPVAVGTAVGYSMSGRLHLNHITLNVGSGGAAAVRHSHTAAVVSLTHELNWGHALCALIVALFIQIGTNYVNDYADGVRGTDEVRVGPVRLVAGGLATVRSVKLAALISFGIAALAGLVLAATVSWWLIPVGLVCGLAGWAYTGGPKPYGYLGLGEVFVFIFFGLVATAGSAFVQHAPFSVTIGSIVYSTHFNWAYPLWAGVPVGLLAVALLEANNMRDIETDTVAEKRTVAVRLGRRRAGWLYVALLLVAALAVGVLHRWNAWALLGLVALPLAIGPVGLAVSDRRGKELLPLLGATARLQIAAGILLTAGIVVGST